uniref:Biotin transporter BioY n=1 Tax=Cyanophora biloba TaxID=1489483 RepID=A0A2Z4HGE8_9EUKA|nr:biotin transporter BioY [Cyanophora biloba]AWW13812.1 biotin transporter BioY [Cyanophora biloba]
MKTTSFIIIWTFIGFLLNIIATFTPFEVPFLDITKGSNIEFLGMGINLQIASLLFVSCVGGATASKYAQLLYLVMSIIGEPLYINGSAFDMFQEPTFGYIIGCIFASETVGKKAFESKLNLLNILKSCYIGLFIIHLCGFVGLLLFAPTGIIWISFILKYSLIPLPSQFVLVFLTSILAFLFRRIL